MRAFCRCGSWAQAMMQRKAQRCTPFRTPGESVPTCLAFCSQCSKRLVGTWLDSVVAQAGSCDSLLTSLDAEPLAGFCSICSTCSGAPSLNRSATGLSPLPASLPVAVQQQQSHKEQKEAVPASYADKLTNGACGIAVCLWVIDGEAGNQGLQPSSINNSRQALNAPHSCSGNAAGAKALQDGIPAERPLPHGCTWQEGLQCRKSKCSGSPIVPMALVVCEALSERVMLFCSYGA